MKRIYKILTYVLLFIILFTSSPVIKADAATSKAVTVTTQSQLDSALNNAKVSKITIKAKSNVNFIIPNGDYHKDLIVYQSKVDLTNNGYFDSLHILIANEDELSKAINTNDVDTITLKTTSKSSMVLNSGKSDVELIVDASRVSVTNNSNWESITIKYCASWVENAQNNNFIVTAGKLNITVNEAAAVKSMYINRSSSTLNIIANGTVEAITLKGNATINISGQFEGQVLSSIGKEKVKSKVKVITSTGIYAIEAFNSPVLVKTTVSKTHIHDEGTWVEQTATTTRIGAKVRYCTSCKAVLEIITSPMLSEEPIVNTDESPKSESTETINGHELVTVTIDLGNGKTKEVKGYYDSAMAQEVFVKLNELRTGKGLNTLSWNSGMAPSADVRAAELTVKFDHWRPNGQYCYDIYPAMTSENVAMGYLSAADVMVGWINSTAHYNAMVKADYKSVSISCFVYEGVPGQYIGYWSMLFSKYN
jgi:uncharacterized protein YkwD